MLSSAESNCQIKIDETRPVLGEENSAISASPEVFTKIFQHNTNIAVLQRDLSESVNHYCHQLIKHRPSLSLRAPISANNAITELDSMFPDFEGKEAFVADLALLVDMYTYLFELSEAGVRIQVLDRAMCPRFHTDKLGCRLVTTYLGQGTEEWLRNCHVDRAKLGRGNMGLPDSESGLFSNKAHIEQVETGDVLLLKGDGWFENDGNGAVHRSPAVKKGDKRLVVTMDFA